MKGSWGRRVKTARGHDVTNVCLGISQKKLENGLLQPEFLSLCQVV